MADSGVVEGRSLFNTEAARVVTAGVVVGGAFGFNVGSPFVGAFFIMTDLEIAKLGLSASDVG